MAGTTFQELLDGVANYYGSGSDQWVQIAQYGVTEQTLPIIQQVPGVTVTVSNSGKYLGYDYTNPFAGTTNPASVINSNVQNGAYGAGSFNAQLPATAVTNPSTGTTTMQSGAVSTATGSTIATIADRASLALAGAALGTKLGKLIDSGIYAANPDWWDEHYPSINPETWDDIATTTGGKNFIRSIFGLQNDNATMYLDERMLAYTYMMLLNDGAYDSAGSESAYDETIQNVLSQSYTPNPMPSSAVYRMQTRSSLTDNSGYTFVVGENSAPIYTVAQAQKGTTYGTYGASYYYIAISEKPFKGGSKWGRLDISNPVPNVNASQSTTLISNKPFYYWTHGTSLDGNYPDYKAQVFADTDEVNPRDIATIIFDGVTTQKLGLDGVSDNPEASIQLVPEDIINPVTGQPVTPNDNPDDVLQALRNQYPDLFKDSIYEDVPQPDGTTQRITYIPTPYPDTTNPVQPTTDATTGIDPQATPQVNPDNRTKELIQHLIDTLTQTPTAPDTGDGNTPPAVIPTGSANALYSIYNPTQAELNSFGAWLWSSNFADQLLKLFNDPMQAIIGLHKVFASPSISGTGSIKVGYLDSGVSSNIVGNQYTTVDCGSVSLAEYFGNVFDYEPYTKVNLYLPFIGIVPLSVGEVMRSTIHVVYHVDVLTGTCLAEVKITRDAAGGTLFQYSGNAAVQYPISSGSYMSIISGIMSIAGGIAGTIATGGAAMPVLLGAGASVGRMHTDISHSGSFSGNAGAMGIKKPYLIIDRPQTALANNFQKYIGFPANYTTKLSNCSGFVKVLECHIENVNATGSELTEIESLLKEGVII